MRTKRLGTTNINLNPIKSLITKLIDDNKRKLFFEKKRQANTSLQLTEDIFSTSAIKQKNKRLISYSTAIILWNTE